MNSLNYWNQFLTTGSIEDYMQYRQVKEPDVDGEGDRPNAGTGECYRHDIEGGTYRGI